MLHVSKLYPLHLKVICKGSWPNLQPLGLREQVYINYYPAQIPFNDHGYNIQVQTYGVAMGSYLCPILPNFYKTKSLINYNLLSTYWSHNHTSEKQTKKIFALHFTKELNINDKIHSFWRFSSHYFATLLYKILINKLSS